MKNFERGLKGRIQTDWDEPKLNRGFRLTDTCYQCIQKLAEYHQDRSRAEYLERFMRAECDRLGISLEPIAEPAEGEQEAA